jgi:hypothetical protein
MQQLLTHLDELWNLYGLVFPSTVFHERMQQLGQQHLQLLRRLRPCNGFRSLYHPNLLIILAFM